MRGAPLRSWCGVFPWRLIPARAGSTCRRAESGRAGRAHPRSRGEHAPERAAVWSRQGSSPLARGALVALDSVARGIGLIPARAGSTIIAVSDACARRAHPRSRGEHRTRLFRSSQSRGSSPLARGAPSHFGFLRLLAGLIPARAGSTWTMQNTANFQRAHPRSRGEHVFSCPSVATREGSSPLARGALSASNNGALSLGLIPARAGSTRTWKPCWWKPRAHPRSRGEHAYDVIDAQLAGGSSPLARGTLDQARRHVIHARLIPARAGNTRLFSRPLTGKSAHPRSRGEHGMITFGLWFVAGSSPLARGTRKMSISSRLRIRLIPARAGNMPTGAMPAPAPPAHPRSRGEHVKIVAEVNGVTGPSPLARGTLTLAMGGQFSRRLIPARAGNTGICG